MTFTYNRTIHGEYQCPYCDFTKANQSTVHMHIKAKHNGTFKYKCEHCDYATLAKQNLENHIQSKHQHACEENNKNVKCPHEECKFTCRTKAQLRSHYLLKHLTNEVNSIMMKKDESFTCSCCQDEFKSKPAFIYHCVKCLPENVADNPNHCLGLAL
jgi:hypothetical protein